jgi:AraC-like DNA-binding protein
MLIVTLFTSFLALLLAIGALLKVNRSRSTYLQAGGYVSIAIILAHDVGRATGWLIMNPPFFGWSLPCAYLLGPLLYWFFRDRINPVYAETRKILYQLVPGAIALAGIFLVHPKLINLFGIEMRSKLGRFAVIPAIVSIVFYLVAFSVSIRRAFILQNLKDVQALRWLLLLCLGGVPAAMMALYAYSTANLQIMEISWFYFSLIVILAFLFKSRYPGYLDDIAVAVQKGKYAVSQLKGVNIPLLRNKLTQLFEQENIYRDDRLSLVSLAKILGVSAHQLSEFFNAELKTGFSAFLIRYRIAEAKQLLLEKQDHTVLAIGFEVGFGSKSAFNSAFRRSEGLSPTEFRQKHSPAL